MDKIFFFRKVMEMENAEQLGIDEVVVNVMLRDKSNIINKQKGKI
ncbi:MULTISPECIES: hypothetical protein [Desemzia]|nr:MULTISPECIES: hypothetical protein [Desemzia]